MRFRDGSDKGIAYSFVQMIRQEVGEERMSCTRKVQTRRDRKKARQVKSKVNNNLIIFFDIKRFVHEEFVLAGQTVNSAYYCDVLRRLRENVRTLRPELCRQKNWLLHHDNAPSHTLFFTRDFFFLKATRLPSSNHPTFLFPQLNIKLKGRHFDRGRIAGGAEHHHRTRLPG
jgi:hypothetical protein